MRTNSLEILEVPITIDSKKDILEKVIEYLDKSGAEKPSGTEKPVPPLVILTPNPEIVMLSGRDKTLKQILRSADINLPDGWGIGWALKRLHKMRVERLAGVTMVEELAKLSVKRGYSVTLIGGGPGVALTALQCLKQAYPGLLGSVLEAISVEVNHEKLVFTNKRENTLETIGQMETILNKIGELKANIVFVGLGCPKQEYLIRHLTINSKHLTNKRPIVFMAVGGSFDYISGRIPRAPEFMRKHGVEWLFRLIREPWRIRRMLRGGWFFAHVALMSRKLGSI